MVAEMGQVTPNFGRAFRPPTPPRRAVRLKVYVFEEGESMRAELWLQVMAGSSHPGFAPSRFGRKAIKRDRLPHFCLWLQAEIRWHPFKRPVLDEKRTLGCPLLLYGHE